MANPAPVLKGVTTIVWGSGGLLAAPLAGAIVESGRITPKNKQPIEVEDNNGFTALLALLVDGFDGELTLVDDLNLAWPTEGATVQLSIPHNGNIFGVAAAANVAKFNCMLASIEPAYARKTEGKKSMTIIYRPGVALQ